MTIVIVIMAAAVSRFAIVGITALRLSWPTWARPDGLLPVGELHCAAS
jgi:hypothetical protein